MLRPTSLHTSWNSTVQDTWMTDGCFEYFLSHFILPCGQSAVKRNTAYQARFIMILLSFLNYLEEMYLKDLLDLSTKNWPLLLFASVMQGSFLSCTENHFRALKKCFSSSQISGETVSRVLYFWINKRLTSNFSVFELKPACGVYMTISYDGVFPGKGNSSTLCTHIAFPVAL